MTSKLLLAATFSLLCGAAAFAQPKIIAHRGYWTAPESAQNSLASLTKAHQVGAFGSEFDVWLTSDNKLIVNHDRLFHGTQIDMERSTQKQITALRLANGESVPTLDAYLKLAASKPGIRLILEIKPLSDSTREDLATAKIVRAVKKEGLLERTDFISFSLNICLAFRKLLPEARIFYLEGDRTPEQVKALGLTGIDYSTDAFREHPEWIDEAHKAGLEVNVWTVDSEADMREFIDRGVDYITTNYPERLQALLKK